MSTTDSIRAAFELHWPNAAKERDGDTYDSTIWECRWEGWQAATEAAKATSVAVGEIDADAEMAKVNHDVELMGVGFLVDGKRCSLDRITWFNRPGDTWLPPPPGYPTEAARQPAPALPVKTWQERVGYPANALPANKIESAMKQEIADLRAALAATAAPVAEIEPCGGCGNSDPDKRCIGCTHPFGQVTPECTFSEDEIYDIERCLRTGVTMGYTKKKGAEKALAIFKTATNRSQP